MEIKFIEKSPSRIKFEIKGEGHTLSNALRDELWVDKSKDNDYYKNLADEKIKVLRCEYSENPIDRVVRSRNILRDFALSECYDYLLSLEQDVIAPNDILARLVARKKDIVSGVYFGRYIRNRQKRILPMLWVVRKAMVQSKNMYQ